MWRLAGASSEVCAKVVRPPGRRGPRCRSRSRRRLVPGCLGAPTDPESEVAERTGRPGVAVGLCRTRSGGGDVVFVEVSRMAGSGKLTLTGRLGEAAQESVRAALSWLRANAAHYGLGEGFQRYAEFRIALEIPRAIVADHAYTRAARFPHSHSGHRR